MTEIAEFRSIRDGNLQDFEMFADLLDVAFVNLNRNEDLGSGMLCYQ